MSKLRLDFVPRNVSASHFFLSLSFIFSLLFSSLGAAGSFGTKFQSFFTWIPTVIVALICLTFVHLLFRNRLRLNFWIQSLLEGVCGSLLFAPLAYFLDVYLGSDAGPYFSLRGIFEEFSHVCPPLTICWVLLKLPRHLGFILPSKINPDLIFRDLPPEHHSVAAEISGTFLELIPRGIGHDVIYLKAEKQYVTVVTPLGSKLVLHGLSQAIESFSKNYGVRIHRSLWVAKKHIVNVDKKDRLVVLSNGAELPISRRSLSSITEFH